MTSGDLLCALWLVAQAFGPWYFFAFLPVRRRLWRYLAERGWLDG